MYTIQQHAQDKFTAAHYRIRINWEYSTRPNPGFLQVATNSGSGTTEANKALACLIKFSEVCQPDEAQSAKRESLHKSTF